MHKGLGTTQKRIVEISNVGKMVQVQNFESSIKYISLKHLSSHLDVSM